MPLFNVIVPRVQEAVRGVDGGGFVVVSACAVNKGGAGAGAGAGLSEEDESAFIFCTWKLFEILFVVLLALERAENI